MACDEIIKFMREISQDIDSNLNSVCTSLSLNETVSDLSLADQAQTAEGVPIKFYDENDTKLNTIVKKANNYSELCHQAIKAKKSTIGTLSARLQEEQNELTCLENTLAKLKKRFDKQQNKIETTVSPLIKAIKVYKLLTGINFAFREEILSGYIKLDAAWDVFEYDRSRCGSKEIQEKLFNLLNTLSAVE